MDGPRRPHVFGNRMPCSESLLSGFAVAAHDALSLSLLLAYIYGDGLTIFPSHGLLEHSYWPLGVMEHCAIVRQQMGRK